ncbi:HATPase_MORC-like domain containing protein [Mycobacteriaceae bacterium]
MAMDWDIAEPRADALIESLRAFGYSPEAAIADLVDNSISAEAKYIAIDFAWSGSHSIVTVADDGRGMTELMLIAAMRPGSTSPLQARAKSDLGRFGLGLKTASFSQARELTVVSTEKDSGCTSTRRWDLDTVARTGEWRLLRMPPADAKPLDPPTPFGTVVQWSKMDRLVGVAESSDAKAHGRFLKTVDRVHQHLAATFHRFLTGRSRIRVTINGNDVEPWDPYMSNHPATQRLESETLPFRGELIKVSPYVLPHRSKLSDAEAQTGAGAHGWNQQQGFYIYRSGRLLIQGDWLGLGFAKDEHTKLARISVDFPAELDHEWQVDVKKSSARPPGELVDSLRRIARATRSKAEDVYRHRGKTIAHKTSNSFVFAWQQYKDRDGILRYKINRQHPVIAAVLDAAGKDKKLVERALRFIEETVPTTMIGVALADSLDTQPTPFGQARHEIRPLAEFVFDELVQDGATAEEALERISAAEPFSQYPEVLEVLREAKS